MDGIVGEVVVSNGLEVTVREQQRRMRHEKGEGEMENKDTCANTFLGTLEPCVYVHKHEDVLVRRKMCVRQVKVCTERICEIHRVAQEDDGVSDRCVRLSLPASDRVGGRSRQRHNE